MPIRAGFTGRRHGRAHTRDAPLGVGHRAFLFRPACRGQQDVGVVAGLGVAEGLLDDDEFGARERLAHRVRVGHRLRRVRAGDPHRLDLAAADGLEHLHRRLAGLRGDGVDAPERRDFLPVLLIAQVPMARQQVRHAAYLAPPHGVGLPRQAERPGAAFSDLPGGQVQVDERAVLPGAARRLVQALAIERERGLRAAEQVRRLNDLRDGQVADLGCPLWGPAVQQ